ncbi:MAG: hypothetical protein ACOCXQ_04270 [Patescibacteria group bacterium]
MTAVEREQIPYYRHEDPDPTKDGGCPFYNNNLERVPLYGNFKRKHQMLSAQAGSETLFCRNPDQFGQRLRHEYYAQQGLIKEHNALQRYFPSLSAFQEHMVCMNDGRRTAEINHGHLIEFIREGAILPTEIIGYSCTELTPDGQEEDNGHIGLLAAVDLPDLMDAVGELDRLGARVNDARYAEHLFGYIKAQLGQTHVSELVNSIRAYRLILENEGSEHFSDAYIQSELENSQLRLIYQLRQSRVFLNCCMEFVAKYPDIATDISYWGDIVSAAQKNLRLNQIDGYNELMMALDTPEQMQLANYYILRDPPHHPFESSV